MKQQCRSCGLLKDKEKAEKKNKHGYHYRDLSGLMWLGRCCPSCVRIRAVTFGRKQGHRPIDDVSECSNKTGRTSEKMAAAWFENRGYRVYLGKTGKGPDLLIQRKGRILSVEVKTAIERIRKTKTTFKVKSVSPNRLKDHLIAYVWKDGHIRLHRMKSHLKKVWKDGDCEVSR